MYFIAYLFSKYFNITRHWCGSNSGRSSQENLEILLAAPSGVSATVVFPAVLSLAYTLPIYGHYRNLNILFCVQGF